MSQPKKVAVLVGSLRKDSFSLKIAHALTALAPPSLTFQFVDFSKLPFFTQDLEATPPAEWTTFRGELKAADAVLFVTPEYNRSVPGALKNAIDVGSRPYGQSSFGTKPAGVISTSIGAVGGFGANHHLRQSLSFLNMPTMGQPEAYVGATGGLFGADGKLNNDGTRDFLTAYAASFAAWIAAHPG
jgi:chromate reductase, NAD(P)H dehydrogenase (quinone)